MAREGACLASGSSMFQSLGPRKEIALCPLFVFRNGSERSVSVFLSFLIYRVEFFLNRLERYSGTRPFSDLYIVVAISLPGGGILDLNLYGDVPTKKNFSPCSRIFAFK